MELPASPPNVNTPTDIRDALIGNLDGSSFRAPGALAADVARMFDAWTRTVTSGSRPRLIVQLEAPGDGPGANSVWLVTVTTAERAVDRSRRSTRR